LNAAPRGLSHILATFSLKKGENPEDGRLRLYRRIFGILWVRIDHCFDTNSLLEIAISLRSKM